MCYVKMFAFQMSLKQDWPSSNQKIRLAIDPLLKLRRRSSCRSGALVNGKTSPKHTRSRCSTSGHTKRKPTTLAVVLRDIQALNEVRGPPSGVLPDGHNPDRNGMTLQERCDDSKSWAAWAPGLKVALVLAIQDRLHRGTTPSLEAALRPLGQVALDSWRAHYLNDHMPAHRDCKLTVLRPIP